MDTNQKPFPCSYALFSGITAWSAMVIGLAVLAGWTWDIDSLKRLLPSLVSMNPVTALAFVFSGISLWLQRRPLLDRASCKAWRFAQCLALVVSCLGLLRLTDCLFGWELGVDQFLFADKLLHDGTLPNRMAPNAAAGLLVLGLALMSLDTKMPNGDRPAELFSIVTLLISLLALIGYAYQVEWLYGLARSIPMTLHTAVALHLLALGILFSRTDQGVMKVIISDSPGGVLARRMFASFVPILVVLGWLCLAGQRNRYYEPDLGVTVYTLAQIGIFGSFIWWSAKSLHRADIVRQQAEAECQRFFSLSIDMFCIIYTDGFLKRLNSAFTRSLGHTQAEMLARPLVDFVHPADQAAMRDEMAKLRQGLAVTFFENRFQCRDGTWKWLSWNIQPYLTEGLLYATVRDVTDPKRSEQALRESEERTRWSSRFLDSVIENLPAMIFVKDAADLRYVRVNRVAEDLTGHSREDFLGKTDAEFYPEDEAQFFAQKDREIVTDGRMIDIPVEPIHSVTRGLRLLHTTKVPIFDEAGCVKYILGISEDITARIATERELRQLNATLEQRVRERTMALAATESKFRTLVEQSLVGIYIIQGNHFVYTNPKMSEIFGYTAEEFLLHPATEFVVESDRSVTAENIRMRLEGTARQIRYHLRMKHQNGTVVHVEAHGTRSDSHDTPAIIGTMLDITERKQAEEQLTSERNLLRTLIDNLPGYIFVKDTACRYLLSNQAHTKLLGAAAESELIGRTVFDFFPKEKAQRFDDDDKLLLHSGTAVLDREEQFETDGGLNWRSTTKVLSRDAQGGIGSIVGIQHDITDRRRTEAEIRVLNTELEKRVQERTSQLEAANKELEAFSYSVSHDLRAPLRHVQGYVEMLEQSTEGRLSDKAKHYVKTIKDSSTDMGQLIDDLLEFSRMGRVALAETSVQMETLARSAIQSLELAVQHRNISWKIATLPRVLGDPAALKQVMANLIGNAVKYTRKRDSAEIEIGCAGEEEGRLVLFVKDNGAGFDMKYSHKLFGVFQRLHRAEDFEGTGIGLATVQRVIGRHGGRAWAEGALDHGATIFFTLKPALAS
jgi:PAS domain S-box-containing protein